VIEHIALHDVFYNVNFYFRYYYFIPSSLFCIGIFVLPFMTLFAQEHGYKRVLVYILAANTLGCLILFIDVNYFTLLCAVILLSPSLSMISIVCLKIWKILPRKVASFYIILSVCIYFLLMSLAIKFYYLIQEENFTTGRLMLGVIFSGIGLLIAIIFIDGQKSRFNYERYQERVYVGLFQAIKHYKYLLQIFSLIFFIIGFRMLCDKFILPNVTLSLGLLTESHIIFIVFSQMILAIFWAWLGVFYLRHKYLLWISIILVVLSNIITIMYCSEYSADVNNFGYIMFTLDRVISFGASTYIVGYCLSSVLNYFRKSQSQAFIIGLFSTLANVIVWVILQLMLI
jgi:MFS family permease